MIKQLLLAVAGLMVAAGSAGAGNDLGVKVYPGAKYDEQMTQLQAMVTQAAGGGSSACYRTKDPVAKVAQYYQKEGFRPAMGAITGDDAMLQKGANVSMRIKNLKAIDNTSDSSICITKK